MDEKVRRILRDYSKAEPVLPLVITLGVCGALLGLQTWKMAAGGVTAMRAVSAVLLGAAVAISAGRLLLFLKGRGDFRRECGALGEEALRQYDSGATLGNRWFMDEYLLFYGKYRPHIMRFDDIEAAEQKAASVLITYSGKKGSSRVTENENAAVILAALKSRNEKIKFIVRGSVVDTSRKGR